MGIPIPSLRILALIMASSIFAEGQTLKWEQLPPLADPLGVAGPFAGTSEGALIVAGGANFPGKMPWEGGAKVWTDRVWILEKPGGKWVEGGKLSRPLAYGASVTDDAGVICVGGSDQERHYADCFRLTWIEGRLVSTKLPSLPIPLAGAAAAMVEHSLYVAGGMELPGEQAAANRCFTLDLTKEGGEWQEVPSIPAAGRFYAAGASWRDEFLVLGGAALEKKEDEKVGRIFLREAWAYSIRRGWRRLADLPRPSVAAPAPAPVIDGRIVLAGGDDGSLVGFQPLDQHPGFPHRALLYDPELNRWSESTEVPAPRATVPCVKWQGTFVIPSGELRPGVRSPEVWSVRGN